MSFARIQGECPSGTFERKHIARGRAIAAICSGVPFELLSR